jgi:hypothetical protein
LSLILYIYPKPIFLSLLDGLGTSKRERNMGCGDIYRLKDNTPKEIIKEIKECLIKLEQ